MNTRIEISTVDIVALMLSLVQFSIIPSKLFLLYRYSIIIILLFRYIEEIFKNKLIVSIWIAYTIILSYSTAINTGSLTWVISAFMLCMQYIVLFCVFTNFVRRRGVHDLIYTLARFFLVVLLFNDVLLVIIPYNFNNPDESYLVGNKFLVSYYHCLLGCLVYIKYKNSAKKNIALFTLAYATLIAYIVHCTTGFIITISIIVMSYLPNLIKKILGNPIIFLGALAVENILIWSSISIFTNPYMVNIMVNIFHKSANMTGREKLYAVTLDLVEKSPLWGYGHNTDIYRLMFGYGNAQNGLFHIIMQAGIIGAILYFSSVLVSLQESRYSKMTYGLIMYLYAMMIGAAIEVSLSTQFILGVAIIYAINQKSNEKVKKYIIKVR